MTHPKVGLVRPHKVLGAQKRFMGPKKIQRNNFPKKLNFMICKNMEDGQGSGPRHPEGVGPLGSIR